MLQPSTGVIAWMGELGCGNSKLDGDILRARCSAYAKRHPKAVCAQFNRRRYDVRPASDGGDINAALFEIDQHTSHIFREACAGNYPMWPVSSNQSCESRRRYEE